MVGRQIMDVKTEWLLCPICQNKIRVKIREDMEIKNSPLFVRSANKKLQLM